MLQHWSQLSQCFLYSKSIPKAMLTKAKKNHNSTKVETKSILRLTRNENSHNTILNGMRFMLYNLTCDGIHVLCFIANMAHYGYNWMLNWSTKWRLEYGNWIVSCHIWMIVIWRRCQMAQRLITNWISHIKYQRIKFASNILRTGFSSFCLHFSTVRMHKSAEKLVIIQIWFQVSKYT